MWIEDRGEGFRADSGFVPRSDLRSYNYGVQRTFWGGEGSWYDQWQTWVRHRRFEDQAGTLSEEMFETASSFQGPLQSFVNLYLHQRRERFAGVMHDDLHHVDLNAMLQPTGALRIGLRLIDRDEIDLANNQVGGPGRNRSSARAEAGQAHQHPAQPHLAQARRTRWRAVRSQSQPAPPGLQLQRAQLRARDPAVSGCRPRPFPLIPSRSRGRPRRCWRSCCTPTKLNPQTVVFVGYNENRLGLQGISLTETDRTFFVKLGYAWTS